MVTRTIDLRSDTVTKPSSPMRAAMAAADVDDDVLGSDPTAARLESDLALLFRKDAALFVPSGTMGNLISVLVHCDVRGSEVILGDNSHIHIFENGGIATIGGVHPKTVKNEADGTMELAAIEAAVRHPAGELYFPTTRLICLENTHANSGGRCISVEYTDRVGELAKRYGLKLHIDGARIFNASVALGVPVHRLVQAADSVSVCLSKGLGAPVGSVIVGSKSFISKARIIRKTLGGGMRQVGVLCAAAHVALRDNLCKLEDDHKKTKIFAEGLNQIKQLSVDMTCVETNMVYTSLLYFLEYFLFNYTSSFTWMNIIRLLAVGNIHFPRLYVQVFFDIKGDSSISPESLCQVLEEHGVLVMPVSATSIRIVIHYQISESDVQYALSRIKQAVLQLLTVERASV